MLAAGLLVPWSGRLPLGVISPLLPAFSPLGDIFDLFGGVPCTLCLAVGLRGAREAKAGFVSFLIQSNRQQQGGRGRSPLLLFLF